MKDPQTDKISFSGNAVFEQESDAMNAKCPILQAGRDAMHARRPFLHDDMDSTVQWSPCQGLEGQHNNTSVDSHDREYQHLYSDVDISQERFRRLKPSAEFRGLEDL